MPKAKVNGVNLYYELRGEGRPLVLIAGFTCDTTVWDTVIDSLSKQFQVLIFDNRGVGQSDSPNDPYSLEDMAKDALMLIQHLGLAKPHLMGHSMGGAIVQILAHRYADQFDQIILANSLIKFSKTASLFQEFMLRLRQDGVARRRLVEGSLPWIFSNNFLSDDKFVEDLIQQSINNPHFQTEVGFKRQLEALKQFDSSSWCDRISKPTLVIGGEEDILTPHDSALLAKKIANSQLVTFSKVGHAPHIEKPEEFVQTVTNFCSLR